MIAPRTVPYVDFRAQFDEERIELMPLIEDTFRRGVFIGGEAVERLEAELAALCGVQHAIALNSGTDALILGMKALGIGPGDEVITPPNSFVASTAAIVHLGATPVFADVLPNQCMDPKATEAAITPRTKAIMPVHLTGRMADMDAFAALAERHHLALVEDAAQSVGSRLRGRPTGSFGELGCFSTHPLKNLNAAGDGGFATTNDPAVAERIRRLRNHGMVDRNTVVEWGFVSRMDALQAEVLRLRLRKLPDVIERRRRNAALYRKLLHPKAQWEPCGEGEFNTFHLFVIQVDRRDALQAFLKERKVGSSVHYPVPIHLQPAAQALGFGPGSFPVTERQALRILSLPIHQFLHEDDLVYVAQCIGEFLDASP